MTGTLKALMSEKGVPSARSFTVSRFIWYFIAAFVVLDAAGLWRRGVIVDFSRAPYLLPVLAACLAVSAIYRYVRPDAAIFLFCQMAGQLIALTAVLGTLSYLLAGWALPMIDAPLIKLDSWLWFDWRLWLSWLDNHPRLAMPLTVAYVSAMPQTLLLLCTLFLYRHIAHIQRYVVAFFYAGFLVIIMATLLPAVGGYVYYDIDIGQLHFHPAAARVHESIMAAARSGSMSAIDFPLQGIVTFPSFHSVLAVLFMYISLPVRWLRAIIIPLNALMLISTPGDGGHYLTDVLAGIVIAWSAIAVTKRIVPYGR